MRRQVAWSLQGEEWGLALEKADSPQTKPPPAPGRTDMLKRLRRKWNRLRNSRPGTRFQNYYRRSRRDKNRDERAPRFARLILAAALLLVGLCLAFLPLVYIPF